MGTDFCVYIHKRPDGSPFYVGKGRPRRAFDFAPSRRTLHHMNIVSKHGRGNIIVEVFGGISESEAFSLEIETIARLRSEGFVLANITDGGEGAAGHIANEKQRVALSKGRGPQHFYEMPEESRQSILDGLARGREKVKVTAMTPEGKAFRVALGKKARQVPRKKIISVCNECGKAFETTTSRAKSCSRKCEQRHRRARDKAAASG